jgi:hypothetical protein
MRFAQSAYLYEFAVTLPIPAKTLIRQMANRSQILPGIDLGQYFPEEEHTLLVAVTEINSVESLSRYIEAFKTALNSHGVSVLPTDIRKHSPLLATGTTGGLQ